MTHKIISHSKLDLESHLSSIKGFTLIELLVVVIIIAVLTAIAVPMYKHAVLKSRFSTVMPMAKSIADAQEVYYQGRQMYALSTEELDVTPAAEGTSISLAPAEQEEQYAYVAASSADVPGARYIMYQKYSPRFAGTIQCEADATNEDALWLCEKGLSGTEIPGSVNTAQGSYVTYLLSGTAGSTDKLPSSLPKLGKSLCEGKSNCTYDIVEDTVITRQCSSDLQFADRVGGCEKTSYNNQGTELEKIFTMCSMNSNKNGICYPRMNSHRYEIDFTADGRAVGSKVCVWYKSSLPGCTVVQIETCENENCSDDPAWKSTQEITCPTGKVVNLQTFECEEPS